MLNTHIEHPEDTILTGDLSVLDALKTEGHLSLKIDGSPAIIWGTHPKTKKFFVGTKSVFNKKLIKVNYTHNDIDNNHKGHVGIILHSCLSNLPRTDNIYQGDFVGFGGDNVFQPNTITYVFPEIIEQTVLIAPHTRYFYDVDMIGGEEVNPLRECVALPLLHRLTDTPEVKFIQSNSTYTIVSVEEKIEFARQMAQLVDFAKGSEAHLLKKRLNNCIKTGRSITSDMFTGKIFNSKLVGLWLLVKDIKEEILSTCENDSDMKAYLLDKECDGEGYVLTNVVGSYKFVYRDQFSRQNFLTHQPE